MAEIDEEETLDDETDMQEQEEVEPKEVEREEQEGEMPSNVRDAREWLSIGWMDYLKGRLSKEKYVKYFADHISKNGVKKLGKLKDSGWYERYNYSREYAAAMVEYVIATYGVKRLIKFYESPTDYNHVFGTTKLRFEQQAIEYIYSKYSTARMQEEIEERGTKEITQICLNNAGGAEMTTIEEDGVERKVESDFFLSLDDKA